MRAKEMVENLLSKGYSEKSIAKKAHVAQSTVHRLKMGYTQYSRWDTVEKLRKVYQQMTGEEGK